MPHQKSINTYEHLAFVSNGRRTTSSVWCWQYCHGNQTNVPIYHLFSGFEMSFISKSSHHEVARSTEVLEHNCCLIAGKCCQWSIAVALTRHANSTKQCANLELTLSLLLQHDISLSIFASSPWERNKSVVVGVVMLMCAVVSHVFMLT